MLDLRGDDVVAVGSPGERHALDRQVVALGAAAGEQDLARAAVEHLGDRVARLVQRSAGDAAMAVQARRVAPALAEIRQHRLEDTLVEGRCGGVIQVRQAGHRRSNLSTWDVERAKRVRQRWLSVLTALVGLFRLWPLRR